MVVHLVRLQLALRRRLIGATGPGQRALFTLRWLLASLLGLAGARMAATADWLRPSAGTFAVSGLLSLVFLGWLLLPLCLPQLTGPGRDPRRLLPYGTNAIQQVLAQTIGGLLSPAGLATFVTAAGMALLGQGGWQPRAMALPGAVLFTLACVLCSHALRALLKVVDLTRPARWVAVVLTSASALALTLAAESAAGLAPLAARLDGTRWASLLSFLPGGAAAALTADLRDHRWLAGGLSGLFLVVVLVLAAWLQLWSVNRWTSLPPDRLRVPAPQPRLRLLGFPLDLAGVSPMSASAGQQLKAMFWRSPIAARAFLLVPILALVPAVALGHAFGVLAGGAAWMLLAATTLTFNVFGADGAGFPGLLISGSVTAALRGKLVAGLVVALPVLVLLIGWLAASRDAWGEALVALLLGIAAFIVGAGLGALTSVLAPYDLERLPAAGRRRVLIVSVVAALVLVGGGLVGAVGWYLLSDRISPTLLALALTVAALLWAWATTWWAGRRLARHGTRIAAAFID